MPFGMSTPFALWLKNPCTRPPRVGQYVVGRPNVGKGGRMASGPFANILRQVRSLALSEDAARQEDARLLDRFLAQRDEAAFEALVRRHGPMVTGVCRRWLPD